MVTKYRRDQIRALRRAAEEVAKEARGATEKQATQQVVDFYRELLTHLRTVPKDGWWLIVATAHLPYDGCFHEPNFWKLSRDFEEFLPLYVSHHRWYGRDWRGGDGIGNPLEGIDAATFFKDYVESHQWDGFTAYLMKSDTPINKYVHENYVPRMTHEHSFIKFKCSACGTVNDGAAHTHEADYFGMGGIAIGTSRIYCEGCFANACDVCHYPFGGEEPYNVTDPSGGDDLRCCKDCIPEVKCDGCQSETSVLELRHGMCPDCIEQAAAMWSTLKEICDAPKLCFDCHRIYGTSHEANRCQRCIDKFKGVVDD